MGDEPEPAAPLADPLGDPPASADPGEHSEHSADPLSDPPSDPLSDPLRDPLAEPGVDPTGEPGVVLSGMSWWGRAWVTLGVLVAIGVTATGVILVRHLLVHPVSPSSLLAQSSSRLTALAPDLAGLDVSASDSAVSVGCPQGTCASAARTFRPTARMTGSTLIDEADTWAALSGLGSPAGGDSRVIDCANLAYAPVDGVLCDLSDYAVPGQDSQQVHIYAELSTAAGKAPTAGVLTIAQAAKLVVGSVYVQVLSSSSGQ